MTVRGWARTCPGCGTRDGDLVEKVAVSPTFRCRVCRHVWRPVNARHIGFWKPPASDDPEAADAWAEAVAYEILEALTQGQEGDG